MISLAQPWWLLLTPLPLLLWHWAQRRPPQQNEPAVLHPHADVLAQLQHQLNHKPPQPWLWFIAIAFIALALSRPQWLDQQTQTRNFMLALDVSGSMRAMDFAQGEQVISRLDMLKRVVDQFLSERQGDRVGLIVFADDAYTLSPLTTDLRLVRQFLGQIKNGMAGEKTALGQAIALGVKRLRSQPLESRTVILLTDGSQSAGEITPERALQIAQEYGVRLYTIGIGSHGKVFFPRGPKEKPDYKEVPMDEQVLTRLADSTGGRYYRATASDELAQIIRDVEQLETISINNDLLAQPQEWYWLPLLLGVALMGTSLWQGQRKVSP